MPSFDDVEVTLTERVSVEFEVFCERCGAGLCANTRTSRRRNLLQVVIEPCEKCLDDQFERGRDAEAEQTA